jgi:hypothetical protein
MRGFAFLAMRLASETVAADSLSCGVVDGRQRGRHDVGGGIRLGRAEQHAVGVVGQPGVALAGSRRGVGDLHVAISRHRGERQDDVRPHFLERPHLQRVAGGVQDVDDRLLVVPIRRRDRVPDHADLQAQAAGVQQLLVAFEDLVAGDAGADQATDAGENHRVARLAGQVLADLDHGRHARAHVARKLVLTDILREELFRPAFRNKASACGRNIHVCQDTKLLAMIAGFAVRLLAERPITARRRPGPLTSRPNDTPD